MTIDHCYAIPAKILMLHVFSLSLPNKPHHIFQIHSIIFSTVFICFSRTKILKQYFSRIVTSDVIENNKFIVSDVNGATEKESNSLMEGNLLGNSLTQLTNLSVVQSTPSLPSSLPPPQVLAASSPTVTYTLLNRNKPPMIFSPVQASSPSLLTPSNLLQQQRPVPVDVNVINIFRPFFLKS